MFQSSMNNSGRLHTTALVIYFLSVAIAAIVFSHPLYLAVLLVVIGTSLCRLGIYAEWKVTLRFSLFLAVTILIINLLVSRNGNTVLYQSEPLPVYGRLFITWEALAFSLVMGLKLITILSLCTLYNVLVSPDRAFAFFARILPATALVVIMSSLFVPVCKRRFGEAHDMLRIRGVEFSQRRLSGRIHSLYPVLKILLLSALEDSWQMAEALHARAYGSGARTIFSPERWRGFDSLVGALSVFSVIVVALSFRYGNANIMFYPHLICQVSLVDVWANLALAIIWISGPSLELLFSDGDNRVRYGIISA